MEKLKQILVNIIKKIKKVEKEYILIAVVIIAVGIFMIINIGKVKEFENSDNKISEIGKDESKNEEVNKNEKENIEENDMKDESEKENNKRLYTFNGGIECKKIEKKHKKKSIS